MQVTIAPRLAAEENERIDAQFFHPAYVESYERCLDVRHDCLCDLAHVTDGNHLKIAECFDEQNGVRYLRGQDLGTDMMLHDRNVVYITEQLYKGLKRSHIFDSDVLITIVGANTGLVGLVYKSPEKLVASCKLGIVRPDKSKILPGYLYAFLAGRFGQHQILRSIRGGGQTGLVLPDLRKLLINRITSGFEQKIHDSVVLGHSRMNESKSVFKRAEQLLLQELGLLNWKSKHQLSFVKSFSASQDAGRFDAEYFQPKYDEIIAAIKACSGGWGLLDDLVTQKTKNTVPASDKMYQYIELSDISRTGEVVSCTENVGNELPSRARRKVSSNDVIASSIEGSLSSIAIIQDEHIEALCSTGFHVINSKTINSETLLVFLKSEAGQLQLKKGCSGTILTAINKEEFGRIVLPLISDETQQKIKTIVRESFDLRKQSKHLLECAKHAVEMAIETDDQAATNWLNDKVDKVISG